MSTEQPDYCEEALQRVLDLHSPVWDTVRCVHPRVGCDRPDCQKTASRFAAPEYRHAYGVLECSYCSDVMDPWYAELAWPCQTVAAVWGVEYRGDLHYGTGYEGQGSP